LGPLALPSLFSEAASSLEAARLALEFCLPQLSVKEVEATAAAQGEA
jgi:hypothetical protein